MIEKKNYKLRHRTFVILGLLAEEPSHPYKLEKKIEERGMKNWTNIGKHFSLSTIYRILDRFENDEIVEYFEEMFDNRTRKVYKITAKGSRILKEKVYNTIYHYYGKYDEDFYVAYSLMFYILSKEELIEAVSNSINFMKNHIKELQDMLDQYSKMPLSVTGLFIHPIKILETDVEFLEMILKRFEGEEGLYEPKTHD
ncbi:MAG: PadR family transcriptional regulator [Candidatus Hermodarchaeota archaeon]